MLNTPTWCYSRYEALTSRRQVEIVERSVVRATAPFHSTLRSTAQCLERPTTWFAAAYLNLLNYYILHSSDPWEIKLNPIITRRKYICRTFIISILQLKEQFGVITIELLFLILDRYKFENISRVGNIYEEMRAQMGISDQ